MRRLYAVGLSVGVFFSGWGVVSAEVSEREMALAKESEAYCEQTSKEKPTVTIIMEKVKKAVDLIDNEGAAALPNFKGKGSEFIFNGTYLWVHDLQGQMLMHPIKTALVGHNILRNTDLDGKLFFREMNTLVKTKNEGWVEYTWPKPGQTVSSTKVSYVHGATLDGKKVVVGCGVYDLNMEQVNAELKQVSQPSH